MTLEATIICVDNSEWMRNGDFVPSRFDAQKDAVNLICAAKTQANPESSVAIMSMADFTTSMRIAQLALRHRQNKHQHQRIVAFVGSPLKESKEELSQLAKNLKKNDIAVDIINFGEEASNVEKLECFINDVKKNDESHLLTVPAGPHMLSDVIVDSKIIVEGSGAYGAQFINADTDPELALALKLSLEEEQQRLERERKAKGGDDSTSGSGESQDVQMTAVSSDANFEDDPDLQQALALSLEQSDPMQGQEPSAAKPDAQQSTAPSTDAFNDQEFLNSTLKNLPGVDPNDERIKNALADLSKKDEKKDDEKKDEQK
ncbi:type A von Willebrand factor domain-containing protein [Heterostelium album PN500]|uniref:26S proteasome regulatory subunit RPN10 n=1 Tax=Heterostelium pallidum (strain ATCC 26659 / Pp 5 / PN500) TaxID=670386 RepID=D3B1A8_HETP5|nr:type A von Willebrand factor domain-containing protein [Heterostelium album PN500]EFA85082.1 type A von Willebrand factor domain-containing protein [Heterostelium album PN500]|eukprot:XP_020437192.1 type A von Willebrand factor domain-containing protein [Heterostelium album PN500]